MLLWHLVMQGKFETSFGLTAVLWLQIWSLRLGSGVRRLHTVDSVIFGSDKNGIGDLTKASGYRLELCRTMQCEGDKVSGTTVVVSLSPHTCILRIDQSLKFF